MATPAAYTIQGVTFYGVFDGYRKGAVQRFINMLDSFNAVKEGGRARKKNSGSYREAFLRGNHDVEIHLKGCKDYHTEFWYELVEDAGRLYVDVQELVGQHKSSKKRVLLVDFIQSESAMALIEYDFKRVTHKSIYVPMRPRDLQHHLDERRQLAETWKKNGISNTRIIKVLEEAERMAAAIVHY